MLDDILSQLNKPGRYIGAEWNLPKKDFKNAKVKFALGFPDLYEVGMSNLGLRIIYGILNNLEDCVCERFFAPAQDMEAVLRNNHVELFSLESKKSLREFDIVGFSLGHELTYTNVLNILELAGIPLKSFLRGNTYPLVIGGGPCALNPEPMHDFFDLFVIGEAEEVILEILNVYKRLKSDYLSMQINKDDLLKQLSEIEGVYVPSFGTSKKIKKRFIKNLDKAYFPLDWLMPHIQIIHDRITLEIMRGCPHKCHFCQARSQYFPFRHRSVENILGLAMELYRRTGYEEISLCGLSVSDYYRIEELLQSLVVVFKEKAVSLSLPSLKPKTIVGELSGLIASIKKTGLTFAPEAATEKLRRVLGKDFNLEDFFKAVEQAYQNGYQHIKLYFMIGLPTEEQDDLDAIFDFVRNASDLRMKVAKRLAQVNISVNTLIPKPHTPFQWMKMHDLEGIEAKQAYLKSKVRGPRFKLNFHNSRMSIMEAVLSRGDRRLSDVILAAFKKGARFCAWENYFSFDKWMEAFSDCGIDYNSYLRQRTEDEVLPWDFIDIGIDKQALLNSYKTIHSPR